MTTEKLLTRAEAAAMLRIHPNSLDRLSARGKGPKRIKIGARGSRGTVRYNINDIHAWLTEHTTDTLP